MHTSLKKASDKRYHLKKVVKAASSSAANSTKTKENPGDVLNLFPMVEDSPSVCSSFEMRCNFDDFYQKIGPLQLPDTDILCK